MKLYTYIKLGSFYFDERPSHETLLIGKSNHQYFRMLTS